MPTKVITTETGNTINYKLIKDGYKTITNSISVTSDMETNTAINLDAPSVQYVSDLIYSVDVTGDYQPLIEINSFTTPDDKTIKGGYYSYMPKNEDGYIYKKDLTYYPYNNFTIVGTPNVNTYTGIVSGFSISNRLQLVNMPTYESGSISSFEFMFKVHTPTTFTQYGRLINDFNSYDNLKIAVGSNYIEMTYNPSLSTINISDITVPSNTDLWIKLLYENGVMSINWSTDGINYDVLKTEEVSSNNISILSSTFDIGARYYGNQDPGCTWAGSIDLSQTYIKINGEYYWNPQSSETITEEITFKAEGILDDSVTTDNYTQIQTHKLFDVQETKTNELLKLTNDEPTIDYLYRQYVQNIVIPARQYKWAYESDINFESYGNVNVDMDTGVASGFDTSSYIENKEILPSFNTFEMVITFKLNSTPSGTMYLLGNKTNQYQAGLALSIQSYGRYVYLRYSSNGSSWESYIRMYNRLYSGTKYYLKFTYDGTTYHLYYSTDGSSWSEQGSASGTKFVQTLPFQINANNSYSLDGEVYLNETYIKLDGEMWWQPGYVGKWVTNKSKFTYTHNTDYADILDFTGSMIGIESGQVHTYSEPRVCLMPKNGGESISENQPNGLLNGNVTFNKETCILSNFSSTNYMTLNDDIDFNNASNWDIIIKLTYGETTSHQKIIYGKGINFGITNSGNLWLWLYDGTSWFVDSSIASVSSIINDSYLKLSFTGTKYECYSSADGTNWNLLYEFATETKIGSNSDIIEIGNHSGEAFLGSIDLSQTYININNEMIWKGVNEVIIPNQYIIGSENISGCFYDTSDDGTENDWDVYYDNTYTQPTLVNSLIDYPSFINFGTKCDTITIPSHNRWIYNNGTWTLFIPPVTPGTDVLVQYYAWKNGDDVFYTKNANIADMDPTNEPLYVYWNKSKPAMTLIFNGYVDNGSLKLDYNNVSYVLIRDSNLDETISETI